MTQPRSHSGAPNAAQVLAAVCAVMEVAAVDMPGKTTPRTKPRLQWARNMAAFVMHDLGIPDGAIARSFGEIHRITILVRRRRMAEKLETTLRYRDHHTAILARLAAARSQAWAQDQLDPCHALPTAERSGSGFTQAGRAMAEPHSPSLAQSA